jgi:hypothetical protein
MAKKKSQQGENLYDLHPDFNRLLIDVFDPPHGLGMVSQEIIVLARDIFLSIGLSQGLRKSVSILALMKLKKAERWAY